MNLKTLLAILGWVYFLFVLMLTIGVVQERNDLLKQVEQLKSQPKTESHYYFQSAQDEKVSDSCDNARKDALSAGWYVVSCEPLRVISTDEAINQGYISRDGK